MSRQPPGDEERHLETAKRSHPDESESPLQLQLSSDAERDQGESQGRGTAVSSSLEFEFQVLGQLSQSTYPDGRRPRCTVIPASVNAPAHQGIAVLLNVFTAPRFPLREHWTTAVGTVVHNGGRSNAPLSGADGAPDDRSYTPDTAKGLSPADQAPERYRHILIRVLRNTTRAAEEVVLSSP